MASLQLRLDCADVSLQRLCMLDRITVLSNSEYVQLGAVTWFFWRKAILDRSSFGETVSFIASLIFDTKTPLL